MGQHTASGWRRIRRDRYLVRLRLKRKREMSRNASREGVKKDKETKLRHCGKKLQYFLHPPVPNSVCSKGHHVKVTAINPPPRLIDGPENFYNKAPLTASPVLNKPPDFRSLPLIFPLLLGLFVSCSIFNLAIFLFL